MEGLHLGATKEIGSPEPSRTLPRGTLVMLNCAEVRTSTHWRLCRRCVSFVLPVAQVNMVIIRLDRLKQLMDAFFLGLVPKFVLFRETERALKPI